MRIYIIRSDYSGHQLFFVVGSNHQYLYEDDETEIQYPGKNEYHSELLSSYRKNQSSPQRLHHRLRRIFQ